MANVLMGRELDVWSAQTTMDCYLGYDLVGKMVDNRVNWLIEEPFLSYAPQIGHLILNNDEGRFALGFSSKNSPDDTYNQASTWDVNAIARQVHERPVDTLDKGSGLRVYTTIEAAMGENVRPQGLNVLAVKIEDDTRILDTRDDSQQSLTGKASRIALHGRNMLQSVLFKDGTKQVMQAANSTYDAEGADLVLISQPPRPASRQVVRLARNLPHTQPGWMLVRDNPAKSVTVERIGTAQHYFESYK